MKYEIRKTDGHDWWEKVFDASCDEKAVAVIRNRFAASPWYKYYLFEVEGEKDEDGQWDNERSIDWGTFYAVQVGSDDTEIDCGDWEYSKALEVADYLAHLPQNDGYLIRIVTVDINNHDDIKHEEIIREGE